MIAWMMKLFFENPFFQVSFLTWSLAFKDII